MQRGKVIGQVLYQSLQYKRKGSYNITLLYKQVAEVGQMNVE